MDLLNELQTRVICGDGAMGTLLLEAGMPLGACLEELNVGDPDLSLKIIRSTIHRPTKNEPMPSAGFSPSET